MREIVLKIAVIPCFSGFICPLRAIIFLDGGEGNIRFVVYNVRPQLIVS
jgi:hypothetical protein